MVVRERIGFADCYIIDQIAPQLARQRAKADTIRRRDKFELHVRLQASLLNWYSALDEILPGRVRIGFPSATPVLENLDEKCSVTAFDRMIAALPYKSARAV